MTVFGGNILLKVINEVFLWHFQKIFLLLSQ